MFGIDSKIIEWLNKLLLYLLLKIFKDIKVS